MTARLQKHTPLFLLLATALLATACSESGSPTSGNSSANPVVIDNLLYRADDAFIVNYTENMQKALKEFTGVTLKISDAQNNQDLQSEQVDQILAGNQSHALLVNLVKPDSDAGRQLVEKAKQAGKPIVFYNRDPGSRALEGYSKAFYVGSIAAESGIIQGQMIVRNWLANPQWDLNQDGVIQYALLKGQNGTADAEERTQWVGATIKNYPSQGIKGEEVFLETANWQLTEAEEVVTRWLAGERGNDIEVIIANNDDMAVGAINALEKHGKKLPVFGVDAMPQALQLIREGKMAGTVLQDTANQSKAALNLSINLARNTEPTHNSNYKIVKQYLMIPYIGIDKSNVNQY